MPNRQILGLYLFVPDGLIMAHFPKRPKRIGLPLRRYLTLAVDIATSTLRPYLLHRAAIIAYGGTISYLLGIWTLREAAAYPSPLRQGFHRVLTFLNGLCPPLTLTAAEQPGNRMLLATLVVVCLWATIITCRTAVDTLQRLFPLQRSPQTSALRWLRLLIQAFWLLSISGSVMYLIAPLPSTASDFLLWRLLRWPMAFGLLSIGYAGLYRLTPRRWIPGYPLMLGSFLASTLSFSGILLLQCLTTQPSAIFPDVTAPLNLLIGSGVLYLASFGLLAGAQSNAAVRRTRPEASHSINTMQSLPPPSFESFKIRRRSGPES